MRPKETQIASENCTLSIGRQHEKPDNAAKKRFRLTKCCRIQ